MAMTKAEKAELERLRADLALARALRWPDYPRNAPMTRADINANLVEGGINYTKRRQMVARGWFYNAYLGGLWRPNVTYGCSDGIHHNREGDTTTSQQAGVMFSTKRKALQNLRLELTEKCANILADVDRQLAECDD